MKYVFGVIFLGFAVTLSVLKILADPKDVVEENFHKKYKETKAKVVGISGDHATKPRWMARIRYVAADSGIWEADIGTSKNDTYQAGDSIAIYINRSKDYPHDLAFFSDIEMKSMSGISWFIILLLFTAAAVAFFAKLSG